MGDPKRQLRRYQSPVHPWIKTRIDEESKLVSRYGLKNKREVWKSRSVLRGYRHQARKLLARLRTGEEQAVKEKEQLLAHLHRMGLVKKDAEIADVLALNVEDILSRRLQTQVYMRGLANTNKQARQFIVHGHIAIGGSVMNVPGYMVDKEEENTIGYSSKSPIDEEGHPVRPSPLRRAGEQQVEKQIKMEDIGEKEGGEANA